MLTKHSPQTLTKTTYYANLFHLRTQTKFILQTIESNQYDIKFHSNLSPLILTNEQLELINNDLPVHHKNVLTCSEEISQTIKKDLTSDRLALIKCVSYDCKIDWIFP